MLKFIKYSLVILFLSLFVLRCKKVSEKTQAMEEANVKPVDFLSDAQYQTMMVDFVYDTGYPPSEDAINNVKSFLNARCYKSGGVQIIVKAISGTGKSSISLDDVKEVERKNRSYYTNGSILGVFVYFTNSDHSNNTSNSQILGTHYGPTSIVIFGKTIKSLSGGLGKPNFATLESSVCKHEFGHALGLVDRGSSMVAPHMDSAHPAHCTNSKCLMYHTVETGDIVINLAGGNVPELDVNCLADLQKNGGK